MNEINEGLKPKKH